ncbi:hypothetical protein I553_0079, partial [Mycobacterium xenopi 4042]
MTTTGSTRQPRSWCTASKWVGPVTQAMQSRRRRRSCLRLRPGGAWLSSPRAILTTSTHSVTRKRSSMANVVNYFEIGTPRCRCYDGFLQRVVDWQIGDSGDYRMVDGDKAGLGHLHHGRRSWAIFYVQVDDVHTAIDKATELGATVVVPFTDNGLSSSPISRTRT